MAITAATPTPASGRMLAMHAEATAATDAGATGIGKPLLVGSKSKRDYREGEEDRPPGFLLRSEGSSRGPQQTVIDRFAEAGLRHRAGHDQIEFLVVQPPHCREEVGGTFRQVAS